MNEAAQRQPVPDEVGELVCSGRGCRRPAAWGLLWNNPRLHTADRRKVWLACDEHRTSLSEYLQVRAFLHDVVPVDELVRGDQPDAAGRSGEDGQPGQDDQGGRTP